MKLTPDTLNALRHLWETYELPRQPPEVIPDGDGNHTPEAVLRVKVPLYLGSLLLHLSLVVRVSTDQRLVWVDWSFVGPLRDGPRTFPLCALRRDRTGWVLMDLLGHSSPIPQSPVVP